MIDKNAKLWYNVGKDIYPNVSSFLRKFIKQKRNMRL